MSPALAVIATAAVGFAALALSLPARAQQEDAIRPGESYVTRFSGVTSAPGPGGQARLSLDPNGTVGSIVDIRAPGQPPRGEHWMDEPQRLAVTAGEVGQVFGVVLDDERPPNIYLSATSAFGLHLDPGTQQWAAGMWGNGGGPGTIYRLDAATGYRPRVFAHVTLGNRPNTGAALGNMTFDRTHKQVFVSDLETGMIHRIRAADGADLGFYDHGTQGRSRFLDVATGQQSGLAPIPFDPNSRARLADCAAGPFERSPECWNFAASGRRVWGIGVRHDPARNETRLYYGVWSSPVFGQTAWNAASDDDKRNAVWSVRLSPDGSFDLSDVRREFALPDFFVSPQDVARAGYSQPVSDITFSECGERPVMLIAERGGIRNLGLEAENPFAHPHEARALRYELDQAGGWQPVGRYDVGYYDRRNEGPPHLRANCAGGIAFGFGYAPDFWSIDERKPDQFVWITGDFLCSAEGPCRAPMSAQAAAQPAPQQPGVQQTAADAGQDGADSSEVHGVQGTPENAVAELVPAAAFAQYPEKGEPYPAAGLDQSYLIDADINVDGTGAPIESEFTSNDATKIGDIAIYAVCAPPPAPRAAFLLPPRPIGVAVEPPIVAAGHDPAMTHVVIASHGARSSHFRVASHNPWISHDPVRSHDRWRSHNEIASLPIHRPPGSWHRPFGSWHRPPGSWHRPIGSVHWPRGSRHWPPGSIHRRPWSPGHLPRGSIHRPLGSHHFPRGSIHHPPGSIRHQPPGSIRHLPPGSIRHVPPGSIRHQPPGSIRHQPPGSIRHHPPGSAGVIHQPPGSVRHHPPGSVRIHQPPGSVRHQPPGSVRIHNPPGSVRHVPPGSARHHPPGSVRRTPPVVRTPTHIRRTTPQIRRTTTIRRTPTHIRRTTTVRRTPTHIRRTPTHIRRTPTHIRRTTPTIRRAPTGHRTQSFGRTQTFNRGTTIRRTAPPGGAHRRLR